MKTPAINFSTALVSILKARPFGEPPVEYRKIEDAIATRDTTKNNVFGKINFGMLFGTILTVLGLGTTLAGIKGESAFQKIRFTTSGLFSSALGLIGLGIGIFSKDPALEEMKKLFDEQVNKYSTESKDLSKKINVTFDDYVQSKQHMGEFEAVFQEIGQKGVTINLMGEVGTGKTYGVRCLCGELAKRTGKAVEHWDVNKDATGTAFGDAISKIPIFGGLVGETRIQRLERIVANAIAEVKKSTGPDGTPKKYIVISVDEVADWLGIPEEKWDRYDFNPDDPTKRSEISNALGVIYNKLLSENGKGIVVATMSNAINKDVSKHLKDRFLINQEYRNPDEELRTQYYFKVLNKGIKEKRLGFQLTEEDCKRLARIGDSNLLLDIYGEKVPTYSNDYEAGKDKIKEGDMPYDYKNGGVSLAEMRNYHLINFRNIFLGIVSPLLGQYASNNRGKEQFIKDFEEKLIAIQESKLRVEKTWQTDLDRRANVRRR